MHVEDGKKSQTSQRHELTNHWQIESETEREKWNKLRNWSGGLNHLLGFEKKLHFVHKQLKWVEGGIY